MADQQIHTESDAADHEPERNPRRSDHRRDRRSQRRLKPNEIEALIAAYREGMTMQDLATAFGIHRVTVSAHLKRHGIVRRNQGLDDEDVHKVVRLYEAGWSSGRLAESFDVNARTILRALRSAGAAIRPRRGWPGASEHSPGDRNSPVAERYRAAQRAADDAAGRGATEKHLWGQPSSWSQEVEAGAGGPRAST